MVYQVIIYDGRTVIAYTKQNLTLKQAKAIADEYNDSANKTYATVDGALSMEWV